MSIVKGAGVAAATAATILAAVQPAPAQPRHHRSTTRQGPPIVEQRSAATAGPAQPQWERDGVPGNDAFNNQLRKFSDPLGAHGGR